MPIFTPGRRWQPAFLPFKRETAGNRALAFVERITKGPLFGCRMCGNCLLQETAFICPMECPKGARNGPCGGSTEASCYVDPTRPCIWYAIYDRAFRLGREELLLEVMPPLDWDKVGGETWGDVVQQVRTVGAKKVAAGLLSGDKQERAVTADAVQLESRYTDTLVGPYPAQRDLYVERSPIHFTERLACPLILFQGSEDKVVLPNQAQTMFEAVKAKGLPVAYLEFEGEGHGFRKAENIKRALDAELYFYSKVFGFELADSVEPVAIENLL